MTQEQMRNRAKFMEEVRSAINRYSMEQGSSTPDFLLAEYLLGCLSIYEHTIQKRDNYFNLAIMRGPKNETPPRTS